MRDRILTALPTAPYRQFLVYVMGPYKAFELADMLPDDIDPADIRVSFGQWNETEGEYEHADVLALLERTRDHLREEVGVNAFLAIDVEIALDEVDAASQSIAFAQASNVVVFIAPHVGKNLGVGIEVGSVLEALTPAEHDRVVFIHEAGVRSAMIASLSRRWDATIYAYADEAELATRLREFVLDIMNREFTGELPQRGAE